MISMSFDAKINNTKHQLETYADDILINGLGNDYLSILEDATPYLLMESNTIDVARKKLCDHEIYPGSCVNNLFIALRQQRLEVYLSGSSSLWSLTINGFTPQDFDFYIPNIDFNKIVLFESALQSILDDGYCITIIDRPLYINFLICKDDILIKKIQLMKINFKSMAEIFVTYHSGLVCSAYVVHNDNYICMPVRFGKMNFSNYLSLADQRTFESVFQKYKHRYNDIYRHVKNNLGGVKNIFIASPEKNKQIFNVDKLGTLFFASSRFYDYKKIGDKVNTFYIENSYNRQFLNNIYHFVSDIEIMEFFDIKYMAYKYLDNLEPTDIFSKFSVNTQKYKNIGVCCELCGLYMDNYQEMEKIIQDLKNNSFVIKRSVSAFLLNRSSDPVYHVDCDDGNSLILDKKDTNDMNNLDDTRDLIDEVDKKTGDKKTYSVSLELVDNPIRMKNARKN